MAEFTLMEFRIGWPPMQLGAGGPTPDPAYALSALLTPGATSLDILWPDMPYLFQDVAGTVPVTGSGQPVRCWKSIAGVPFAQSVSADAAPTSAPLDNGAMALAFDGIDDWLQRGSDVTPVSSRAQVIAGIKYTETTMNGPVVELSTGTNANNRSFSLRQLSSGGLQWVTRGDGAEGGISSTSLIPFVGVATGTADYGGDGARVLRVDAVEAASSALALTGNFPTYPLFVGSRISPAYRFNGLIGPLVVRFGDNLTTDTLAKAEAIIQEYMGS